MIVVETRDTLVVASRAMARTVVLVLILASCGGGSGHKADGGVDAFFSLCGHPGDVGNSLGVGKFCLKLEDCQTNSQATICSSLGNDPMMPHMNSFFCTMQCTTSSPAGFCGTGASCQCGAAGCGCAPVTCSP
jgi:hypothetical protein